MKRSFTIAFCFFSYFAIAQSINNNWKQDLNKELSQFLACENNNPAGISPCNNYMSGALKTIYKVEDFYLKDKGRHMIVSEISNVLKNSKKWTLLGYGYEQKALTEAQTLANAHKAVVAIYVNDEGIGHVSIIVPGELKQSGTWGFQVPNSVSFFPNNPEKSYIDKSLSYSFEKSTLKNVLIYARNY